MSEIIEKTGSVIPFDTIAFGMVESHIGNFEKQLPIFKDDQIFDRSRFVQKQPHTAIAVGKKGLVFRGCNLMNCDLPPGTITERCLTVHKSLCSHIHPDMGLPKCAEDCEHCSKEKQWVPIPVDEYREIRAKGNDVRILGEADSDGVIEQDFQKLVWVYEDKVIK